MEASFKLGRIWGIPIGLHTSWFLIFGLLTWSLATGYFPAEHPQLAGPVQWVLALVTAGLFFGSVLAHELGHAWVALRERLPVRSITLFIFGGVAQIGQQPPSPGAEFRIAIAGPLVSLGLAAIFGGLWLLDQSIPFLAAPSAYLLRINAALAVFNLIPGFPLDGGRVLRALVWRWTGSFGRATRTAAASGQLVAFGFIALGVFTILQGSFFNGLWLAFIGWFLQNAAASATAQTSLQGALSGVTVRQVMTPAADLNRARVTGLTPLTRLVEERVLTGGQRLFLVGEDAQMEGLLTLRDISAVPQAKWPFTTARQVMTPAARLATLSPDTELLAALQRMDDADVAQAPVLEGGSLVGLLTRDGVVRYLRTKAELGV